jgi:hypothetical protein
LAKKELKQNPTLNLLHRVYGKKENETCGHCIHLVELHYGNTYFKCDLTVMTSGAATDWRKGYVACGKFVKKFITKPFPI